jgi:diguanylate cyclase (GGDEF)-like protein
MHKADIIDDGAVRVSLVAMAGGSPLSVALVDIDNFADINATYGRETGDAALETVGRLLMSAAEGGYFVRTGGDEFLLARSEASPEEMLVKLDMIRRELETPQTVGAVRISLPISIGIASSPHHTDDPGQLRELASAAMHRAKTEGRNRVAIFAEDRMVLKSNYYSRQQLARLASLAHATGKTEASLLREALGSLLDRHRELT